jgi:O-antigen/teichoic acid export membrane protein
MDQGFFKNKSSLEFLKHSKNYLSASLIQNFLLVLSVPVFTNLLQPEEYGILSIFTLLVTLLTIIFGLNLKGGIFRYYFEEKGNFAESLYSNIVFIVCFDIVVFFFIYIFKNPIATFFSIDENVFFLASSVAVFSVPLEMYMAYLQSSKQSMKFSYISVVRVFLVLVISIIVMFALSSERYLGKMYGEIVVMAFVAFYALRSMFKLTERSFDTKYLKYTLRYSLPLIPHALSRFILGYFDRVQINQLLTPFETGIYSFAYDVGMAMDVIVMASVKAWNPVFLEKYVKKELKDIESMAKDYAKYICAAAIIIILFSKEVVVLLAPEKYYEAVYLVPVIVMGYSFVFLYSLFFQYASYRKRTELIAISSVLAGAINIVLNYIFIPIYGYMAAAVTTMISYGLLFFFHYFNARFILKEKTVPLSKLLPFTAFLAIFIGFYTLLTNAIHTYWILLIIKVLFLIVIIYLFFFQKKKKTV